VQLREQRQQAVSTLIDSRFDWAHAFHELGRVLTGETDITGLSGSVGAATTAATVAPAASTSAASTTPAGSIPTFTLQGCAKSQRAVALTLERLRLIDGVNEVTLQSSTKAGSGSSSGGSGGCPGGDPSFSTTITFDALPSTAAAAAVAKPASAKTVSDPASTGAVTAAPAGTQTGATGGVVR